jgi:acylphosphatase
MKLKMRITGPKVHDVGYRYFLMSMAMANRIRMFEAHNIESNEGDEVLVFLDGDEETVKAFRTLAETKRPARSEVSNIAFEDYYGDVMKIGEFAQFCSIVQLDKAIPVLLDMRDDLRAVRKNTDIIPQMSEDIKAVRKNTDIIPQISEDIKAVRKNTDIIPQISEDIKAVRKNTDTIPQVLEEIKGMREDIQPGYGMHFRQVQSAVRAITARLGMI